MVRVNAITWNHPGGGVRFMLITMMFRQMIMEAQRLSNFIVEWNSMVTKD